MAVNVDKNRLMFFNRKPFLVARRSLHVILKREQKNYGLRCDTIETVAIYCWPRQERKTSWKMWTIFIWKYFVFHRIDTIESAQFFFFVFSFHVQFRLSFLRRHSWNGIQSSIDMQSSRHSKSNHASNGENEKNENYSCLFLLSGFHGNHLHSIFSWI